MPGRERCVTAILVAVVLLALLAWGCAGGGQSTSTSSGILDTTTLVPPGNGSAGGGSQLLLTQLKTTEDTPTAYVDAVAQGRPIVLLFYVAGGADDMQVLESLTRLQPAFEDYVFLIYDYKMATEYGDLSTLLRVSYPPELVLVDDTGTIREIWNGYVDEGTINQSLVNLGGG